MIMEQSSSPESEGYGEAFHLRILIESAAERRKRERMMRIRLAICTGIGILATATAAIAATSAPSFQVERVSAGLVMHHDGETMQVSVCGAGVLHVVAGPGNPQSASPATPWPCWARK
jgi:hypothetical protein